MTEQMNVPMLRFGEYAGDWHTTTVGQLVKDGILFKPLDGNHGNIHPKASDYVESGIPFLMASDIQHGQADLEGCKFISKELADSLQKGFACEGDVLLTHKGTVGETTILQGINTPYVMLTPQVTYYRVKNSEKLDNVFLQKLFTSESFRKDLFVKADSGTRPYIGILGQLTLNLTLPEIDEQQKIASFLSKFDEKIALLTAKKNKLTEYKKGVMQQLFNGKWEEQDGQLTFIPPTLRFKADDGSEFPDWVEKTLGDVSEPPSYGLNSAATKYDGVNKYIRITDIDEDDRSFSPSPLTSPEEVNDAYLLEEGDIVFARTGASVGKSYLYNKDDGRLMFAGFLIKFSVSKANPKFISYQMTTSQYEHWVKVMSVRSGQPGINAQEYSTYSLNIPCTEEQEQIANFLSALDHKIDLLSSELEKAKEWKKGLLQQMFV
ncbi:restriction endonuclease subunit S [Vibrio parahaemolyticus]|uniref:restriction endonuclease subunit S n=1 Tax=Vibrio parahaemolyticus TaxID=670 RepID=UPI000422B7BE|nr:restriction endonuclease subunit S [Vibrio parahaemolyticus]MBE4471703.1 restriction endonuclease subunit S [Vibrio parahaemolyticus]MEA5299623.1 restriction endonuclease subunit S [Vibrio parahaemolyticus]TOF62470.1 restriction endonuclease subunit S [Vibrio parahaemolyticus]HCG6159872.1 restriction endonuclease subunit S [Vibrio parahaemolyticus]